MKKYRKYMNGYLSLLALTVSLIALIVNIYRDFGC